MLPQDAHILHVVPGLHPRSGGPSYVVVELTDALAQHPGLSVTLVSQSRTGEPTVASAGTVDRHVIASSRTLALRFALPVRSELNRIVRTRRPALIHTHGLWSPASHWAAQTARRHGIPLVVHPHGMLDTWALQHKAWKKRVALSLYQSRDLRTARVLIATAPREYDNIRGAGVHGPVALIPNGVDYMSAKHAARPPADQGERIRTVLFLSRVHPQKGLLNLLRAWAQLSPRGWRLCIAGPDEGGHLADVMALARKLAITDTIDYVGEVDGERKTIVYDAADLFVLPTFGENFGVVVAEALAHGLPVVTTRGAPWEDLETERCGWWIEIGVDPLAAALRAGMALSDEERQAMGARGRKYVQRYDWNTLAHDTAAVYAWVLGAGPRPACVELG